MAPFHPGHGRVAKVAEQQTDVDGRDLRPYEARMQDNAFVDAVVVAVVDALDERQLLALGSGRAEDVFPRHGELGEPDGRELLVDLKQKWQHVFNDEDVMTATQCLSTTYLDDRRFGDSPTSKALRRRRGGRGQPRAGDALQDGGLSLRTTGCGRTAGAVDGC